MCGLAGYSGDFSPELLTSMSTVITHRGPDDDGEWFDADAGVGLCHRRLSIIDTSARGHQPMWDSTRQLVIAFNGEIYDYASHRAELEADGFGFRSETDTEVVLNLWLQRGRAALEELNGMYGLAIWDTRDGTLTLARDPAGIKPLYFSESSTGVVFGSEIKSLLQSESVDRQIDPVALVHTLTYLWCPGPRTMLTHVKKLAPGSWLEIRDGSVSGSGTAGHHRPQRTGVVDAPQVIRRELQRAVREQLVADVPTGAFLSGGLDSTAIVALAKKDKPDIACFTIGSSKGAEGFESDLPFARLAAKRLGVELHVAEATPDLCDHIDFMLYHLDEPQADIAPLQVYLISAMARSLGVKVLLSGAGGDDLFGGYRRHVAAAYEKYWQWLPATSRTILQRSGECLPVDRPWSRRVRKLLADAGEDPNERMVAYLHWMTNSSAVGLLSPEFRGNLDYKSLDGETLACVSQLNPSAPNIGRLLALDEDFFLVDHNFNYTDKLSMAAGVEVRVPFMDRGVVDVAHRLRTKQLVKGRTSKSTLREAVRGLVPDEIITRSKVGFGVPLREWMTGPLEAWLRAQLEPAVVRRRGIFDAEAIARTLDANNRGEIDASYPLFACAMIERWLQLFVDAVPGSDSRPSAPLAVESFQR